MQLRTIVRQVPDARGKQGQDDMPWSILGLTVVPPLGGRGGMKPAFLVGRGLTRRQKSQLCLVRATTPCHATLTETPRVIAARTLADVLGARYLEDNGKADPIAIVLRQAQDEGQDDAGEQGERRQGRTRAFGVLRRLADAARTPARARQGLRNCRRAEALRAARPERQDRHRRRDLLANIASPRKSSKAAAAMFFRSRTTRRA